MFCIWPLSFARTAVTKYHKFDGLNNKNVLPQSIRRLEVQNQGVGGVGSLGGLGERMCAMLIPLVLLDC